jgi:hypothetical protein
MRAFCTLLKAPRPALYKQAAAQPFEAIGQRLIFAAFCVCGAKYKIKVFISFFAVFAFVWPGLNSRAGIV